MNSPRMKVRCNVTNCQFNRNRMCHASDLEVGAMGDGRAETTDGTCCRTFENKE